MTQFPMRKFSAEFRKGAKRIVVLGSSGSGKTYFANQLTMTINLFAKIPVLIVDTKREDKFKRIKSLSPIWVNDHKPTKTKIQSINANGEIAMDYRVGEFAAAVCWTMQKSVLYLEEVVQFVGKSSVNFPQERPLIYKILQQGRERNCSLIVATQRPAQLNLSFVDEATDLFFFAMGSREVQDIEDNFRLPKLSLRFQGKPEFGFYHITGHQDPTWYDPIRVETKKPLEETIDDV